MTTRFAKVKKFAGMAVMATAVAAVGLGLGAGTAQAVPKHPDPDPRPHPTLNQVNQRIDNFFDRHLTGEGTRVDNFFDRLNRVR